MDSEEYDVINPAHYRMHPSGVECIDIIEVFPHNIAACMGYLWRAGLKPGAAQLDDMRKAAWHLNREIERIEKRGVNA
jgi:hypothetical protein